MIIDMPPEFSIFDSTCQALVNPVNCEAVSGKGLAREFRMRYPAAQKKYQVACEMGLSPGYTYTVTVNPTQKSVRWIVCFPTKDKWRDPSRLSYIRDGLVDLIESLKKRPAIQSIAIPALGCGLGGLDWKDVRPMIVAAFEELPDMRVELYPPK